MDLNIDQKEFDEIADMISSTESVVGIDAKKTHIIIIQKLMQIEKRLDAIENATK